MFIGLTYHVIRRSTSRTTYGNTHTHTDNNDIINNYYYTNANRNDIGRIGSVDYNITTDGYILGTIWYHHYHYHHHWHHNYCYHYHHHPCHNYRYNCIGDCEKFESYSPTMTPTVAPEGARYIRQLGNKIGNANTNTNTNTY